MARTRLLSKKTTSLIVGLIVLAIAGAQQAGWLQSAEQVATKSQPGQYKVTRFVDGDTITVDMNGTKETIRMLGVDTPETHKPNAPVQCYGPAASAYTKNLIGDQTVRLEADPENQNRDRYGRLLRYVYLPDGKLISRELIANGYGFAYTLFPFTKTDDFVAAEEQAKAADKGLWGNCTVTTRTNGAKQTNDAP
ncbi:MAG TPA: thermonuclease family protein [Candidatus Saccharimonadales bacterium]|nr:thermonuclease family protein [Candidatus Saccharimonadales bacterium]